LDRADVDAHEQRLRARRLDEGRRFSTVNRYRHGDVVTELESARRDDDDTSECLAGLGVTVGLAGVGEGEDLVVDDTAQLARTHPLDVEFRTLAV